MGVARRGQERADRNVGIAGPVAYGGDAPCGVDLDGLVPPPALGGQDFLRENSLLGQSCAPGYYVHT
ncbi:MAG: hypothetical protein DHS20C04_25760 [Hyphococcus sp.]|nr:MAG: hypothetical protein DHS20C04_25760 [Marinicaulis sp.]